MLLSFWIAHWIGLGPTLIDCNHFLGKQLVAIDTLWASLRPPRTPPFDTPYPSAFQHIRPIHKDFWKRKGLIFILNRHLDFGASVVVLVVGSSGLERNTLLVVQLPALSEHVLSNRVSGLVVSAKMIQFARLDWKGDITVVIDPAFLSRSVIAEQFRGVEPWLSSSWTAMENTFQVMRHAFLPPNKIPNGLVDVFSPV